MHSFTEEDIAYILCCKNGELKFQDENTRSNVLFCEDCDFRDFRRTDSFNRLNYKVCQECKDEGILLWCCATHTNHEETDVLTSHKRLINLYESLHSVLLQNRKLCTSIGITNKNQFAQFIQICEQEWWKPGDILGNDFQAVQNRWKIQRHFIASKQKGNANVFTKK
jgi:hypothetical protein